MIRGNNKCPCADDQKNEEKYMLPEKDENCLINKIITFDDYYYSLKNIFIFLILAKIMNLFNEKLLFWIALNIIILYGPLDKKCPYFLFKSVMYVLQIFDGVFGLLKCLIPAYEEEKKSE